MFLPPVRPSTRPRPMNSVESVAMKVGTCSQVTSRPLISPTARPMREADREREPGGGVVQAGREQDREHHRRQAHGRADREVEVLVDQDEGHADRDHAELRGVAQHRVQGRAVAPELRVDPDAGEIEQRHHGDDAELPAAERTRAGEASRRAVPGRLESRAGGGAGAPSAARAQFSKRLPTASTLSLVTSCALVSRSAAAMPRSICR